MKLRAVFLGLALVLASGHANASLTPSEKAQVRDFVAGGRAENAQRVRSLVARTDLAADESIGVLRDAVSVVPFTNERAVFLRELVFGASSAPSRPLLAHAVTRALLARADAVYQKYVGGLDHEPRAIAELVAIYTFLDAEIANAGRPTKDAHDPSAGLSAATYDECSKALREHVEQNARWLKGDGPIAESVARVRAQAQATLLDMLPDGLTRRVDAADRLGLKGARRQMLLEWGLLLEDGGKLDELRAERVRQVLVKLPGARVDLELLFAGDDKGPLRARGGVAYVGSSAKGADQYPFSDDVQPGTYDAPTSAITQDLAVLAVKHALDNRADLRLQAERDAAAAQGDPGKMLGRPRAPSIDHVIGAAAHLLLLDAPRAIDLAFVRLVAGRAESAAILSDAIAALAADGGKEKEKGQGPSLDLGKGAGASTTMTAVRLAPNGVAVGFALEGHTWTIERVAPSFAVTSVRRDAQPLSLAFLPTARTPLSDGTTWTAEGTTLTFGKLRGSPRAGIAPAPEKGAGPTVKLVGVGTKGYDAIATATPAEDFVLEGDLTVRGATGGIAFRAVNGREAVRGAMFLVTPGGRAAMVTSDDSGGESFLSAAIDPAPPSPVHVKITVKGAKVEAVIGQQTLQGTLPPTLAKGDVGLVAKHGASVDLAGFSLKKAAAK
jgi:hypothetical protein